LQHKLSLTAYGSGYKAVIINDAERLNKTAQNALLKTLEEPNAKVVLVLVAKDEDKLLPTILSRCQKIRFGSVADQEMEEIVSGNVHKKEMLFWSTGRPGLAKKLIDDPTEFEYREKTARELSELFSKNTSERFSLAESWSKDENEIQKKLDLWLIILRESMLGKNPRVAVSPDKSLLLIEDVAESMQILKDTNTNPKLVLENLFLKL
jgi:DNA polymerase III subunit delta'